MLADMSETDLELLARYASRRAEDAFAELVRRHVNLVYSAALRQVRSPQLAEEVAQSAFVDLARNATRLRPDTILTAWLYQVAHHTAIDVVRREASRQLREQIATEMNAMNATAADWTHIEPLLDDAMHALDETDRAAVLLRYFENKSLREVGQALGASENAAQKRLTRAVESLREFFAKRGVTIGASGLIVVISANAVQAAPVGLAVTISTAAALAGTTLTTAATATATNAIAMTTLQKTAIAAIAVVSVTTPLAIQHQSRVKLLEENQALRQRVNQANRPEEDGLPSQLQTAADEVAKLREEHAELLRLRGEVARLRQQAVELETSRKEKEQFRAGLDAARNPGSNEVASAKAVIFDPAAGVEEKLAALRILRSANARSDDVVMQMVRVYYSTENPDWRADIFRQLGGVKTPELKRPLLEAVSDATRDPKVREEAAETLAEYLPDPDVKAWLDHLAAHDTDEEVRAQAKRSLQASQRRRR
jgi:RNA polymerase sigma factor (sigma-70 family)